MTSRGVHAALFALAVLAGAPSAHADDDADAKKEAQTLFTQGLKLAESKDPRGALAAFRSAYDKFPNYRVLYNIGQICSRLADPACTVRSFEQYLRDGDANVAAKRRAEIDKELKTLRRSVGSIAITVSVMDASVSVDDAPIGHAPITTPYVVNPGSHGVTASLDGRTETRTVTVASGETASVTLDLPKAPEPPPEATPEPRDQPTEPRDESPPPPKRSVPVAPWIVTGGLALGTIVTGVLAARSYSSFQDKKEAFPVTRQELDDTQGSARTLFFMTGIFGACTVISAGVAAYLTVLAPPSRSTTTTVGIGPGGIALQGRLP
jgi:hypothetical protein